MTEPAVAVHILELPVPLQVRAGEHTDALRREFALLREARTGQSEIPTLLHDLMEQLTERFGGLNDVAEDRLALAVERAEPSVDLVFSVPPEAAVGANELDTVLDRADEFCRQGEHLLTLVAPTDVARFRRWFLGEFVNQVAGADPVPWPAYRDPADSAPPEAAAEPPAGDAHAGDAVARLRVDDDLDMQAAPDLREALHHLFAEQPARLVLDLSRVAFIDSVGISVVLAALRRMSEWGGTLELVVSPAVRRTLTVAGLDDLVDHDAGRHS